MKESLHLLNEKGVGGLTIKNLAKRLELTEGAIYRHFVSKEEILGAIADHYRQESLKVLNSIQKDSLSNKDKLQEFFLSRAQLFENNRELAIVVISVEFGKTAYRVREILDRLIEQHKAELQKIIKKACANGELRQDIRTESLFRMIFGSLRFLVYRWHLSEYSFSLKGQAVELWRDLDTVLSPGIGELTKKSVKSK